MHLTLVPYIPTAGEIKTKPTQHSVKELRSIGLQADVLLCRCSVDIDESARRKISLFTNVEERAVIPVLDADSIYKIPKSLHEQGLDDYILERFGMSPSEVDFSEWDDVVAKEFAPRRATVKVGMVGKYTDLVDAYKSLNEALGHAGLQTNTQVDIEYIDAEDLETQGSAFSSHSMRYWSRVASGIEVSRGRSLLLPMREKTRFRIWVSALACTWR